MTAEEIRKECDEYISTLEAVVPTREILESCPLETAQKAMMSLGFAALSGIMKYTSEIAAQLAEMNERARNGSV